MVTRVCVQVATLACMNFSLSLFFVVVCFVLFLLLSVMKIKLALYLNCVVHTNNERNSIVFIPDSMTKINQIECEHDAEQPPLYSLTSSTLSELAIFSLKINLS